MQVLGIDNGKFTRLRSYAFHIYHNTRHKAEHGVIDERHHCLQQAILYWVAACARPFFVIVPSKKKGISLDDDDDADQLKYFANNRVRPHHNLWPNNFPIADKPLAKLITPQAKQLTVVSSQGWSATSCGHCVVSSTDANRHLAAPCSPEAARCRLMMSLPVASRIAFADMLTALVLVQ